VELSGNIVKINDLRDAVLTSAFAFDQGKHKTKGKTRLPQKNAEHTKKEKCLLCALCALLWPIHFLLSSGHSPICKMSNNRRRSAAHILQYHIQMGLQHEIFNFLTVILTVGRDSGPPHREE
jgi:hypothetical protein